MNRETRPYVVAPWPSDKPQIPGWRSVVEIDSSKESAVRRLYGSADGTRTVGEIAIIANCSQEAALSFFQTLEHEGLCFDVSMAGLVGHVITSSPDAFHQPPNPEEVPLLMRLPPDPSGTTSDLVGTIDHVDQSRRSTRSFSAAPITFAELSSIVLSAYGITEMTETHQRRTVPSGGAFYPLQHDFFVSNVEGLDCGHWRLLRHRNAIVYLGGRPDLPVRAADAPVVHVIGFDIDRSSAKYGARAYRLCMLEAGHSAQNAMRKAAELGLGSCETAEYLDIPLEEICGLSKVSAGVATVISFGRP